MIQQPDGSAAIVIAAGYDRCSALLVPGVGFEPTSPRFRRGAVTRSASQAVVLECAYPLRKTGIACSDMRWNWRGRRESNPHPLGGAQGLFR